MGEDLFAGRFIALSIRRERHGKHPGEGQHDRVATGADPGERVHKHQIRFRAIEVIGGISRVRLYLTLLMLTR